jgi:hypothetical protein
MYINGFDPSNPEDIKLYWEERLGWIELQFTQKRIVFTALKLKWY